MKSKVLCLILVFVMLFTTGCVQDEEAAEVINRLNSLQGVNIGFAEGQTLSFTERQALLYKRLRNHQLLKLTGLNSCSSEEITSCVEFIDEVDKQLCGQVRGENSTVPESMIDYLLLKFEATPYYWQRSRVTIQGKDNAADYIIVDVTYHTIDFAKDVLKDSSIVLGEPNYQKLASVRMDRALAIFDLKYKQKRSYDDPTANLKKLEEDFINAYGTFQEVYDEQNNYSPSEYIYLNGNQKTTSGVIRDTSVQGEMTFRFVLNPHFIYGINMGMECQHCYLLEYKLNEQPYGIEDTVLDMAGYNTLATAVYDLIKSYFTCLDEANFDGLYKLVDDFGTYDKFYQDWFTYAYLNHDNFRIEITSISGTTICGNVYISSGERPRGTRMTLPLYTDTYKFEVNLYGEVLKLTDIHCIKKVLEGEPAITVKLGEETGFSYNVDLSDNAKSEIEKVIAQFGVAQLHGIDTADGFINLVDLAISEADMTALKQNTFAIKGDYKSVWIQSYIQGNSNYALVQCREQVKNGEDIHDYITRYEFILRGSSWSILSYNVTSTVKLSISELNVGGALCICSADNIESFTSQVANFEVEDEGKAVHEVYTQDYQAYKPTIIKHDSLSSEANITIEDRPDGVDIEVPEEEPTFETQVIDWSGYELSKDTDPLMFLLALREGIFSDKDYDYLNDRYGKIVDAITNMGVYDGNYASYLYETEALKKESENKGSSETWLALQDRVNDFYIKIVTATLSEDDYKAFTKGFETDVKALRESEVDLSSYLKTISIEAGGQE